MTDAPRPAPLSLAIEPGPTTVIRLVGELDPATAPQLERAVHRALAEPAVEVLVLDLADLGFVDSSGLRVFVTARDALHVRGGHLRLRSPNAATRRILDLTGLDTLFEVD